MKMPNLGEIKATDDIGFKGKNKSTKLIWAACIDCGKERWTRYRNGSPETKRCQSCNINIVRSRCGNGERGLAWKGGRIIDRGGYFKIWVKLDDFYRLMANKHGYVAEHRLIMAKSLGRNLHSWEIVHHKNHNRKDNRLENLELMPLPMHNVITRLEVKVRQLEAENAKLRGMLNV